MLRIMVCALALGTFASAQGTREDYERAAGLAKRFAGKVFRDKVEPHWLGGDAFWYRVDTGEGRREFVFVDAVKGSRTPAFDHDKLAAALGEATDRKLDPQRLMLERFEAMADGSVRFGFAGKGWSWNGAKLTEAALPKRTEEPKTKPATGGPRGWSSPRSRTSPDGKWTVQLRDHDLWLKGKDGTERRLSTDGSADDAYSESVHWSPDSTKLAARRTKAGEAHDVHIVESSPKDRLQPKLHTFHYYKPGDRLPIPRPVLFDAVAGKPVALDGKLFENAWSIDDIRWDRDSSRFTFAYNRRGHQVLRILAVDARTGRVEPIVDETSRTFVDYAGKHFVHYIDDAGELIWMSERDGWNHLYLFDAKNGQVKSQITKGSWVVLGVDRVDEKARQVWFRAGGVHADQDPYHVHHCRANFDGSGFVVLTQGDGTHTIERSPDGRYFIDTYSRVDVEPTIELRRSADGKLVVELEKADTGLLQTAGWIAPERFVAKGRDGSTDIWGVIWRPTNFDPKRKYPVIEHIYAGPHSAFVPKSFRTMYGPMTIAELGFVVVQIDGMGTSKRSKAFHDVCWKNLGDSGFPDRMLWMKAAAAKHPYMDLSRVGIYGGSAGGQSALRALLSFGDFYHAAAADCGCHDNRMDKVWWNELWMSWPVGPHYAEQSNVTNAHRLKGKLLLTVGELDRNVDPTSTMQVVDALIKAGKDFEFIVVPGAGHGVGESPYCARRRQDFFVRSLLGVEPRSK